MSRVLLAVLMMGATAIAASAQTPQPFPRPGSPPPPQTKPSQPPPAEPAQPTPQPAAPSQPGGAPTEATLGVPVYPGAQFITSYDAGRGQRYYLYGVVAPFAEMVTYYRTTLKQRGELLFESPATHMFEVGRYRDDAMAFPPSVTIKDYASGGAAGYPNPVNNPTTTHFPTIIQIVPAPAVAR
jgi:hypothetical protein